MAKIIEKNGNRILVSDNMPDDILLEEDDPNNQLSVANIQKKIFEPVTALLTFKNEDYPTIPIEIISYKTFDNKLSIKGLMLTTDFAWLNTVKDSLVEKIELDLPNRRFTLCESRQIKKIYAKDMNKVTSTVDLFLTKHI
jgi:hypothetical protein